MVVKLSNLFGQKMSAVAANNVNSFLHYVPLLRFITLLVSYYLIKLDLQWKVVTLLAVIRLLAIKLLVATSAK